jgi:phosphate transport system substrate-binding protein
VNKYFVGRGLAPVLLLALCFAGAADAAGTKASSKKAAAPLPTLVWRGDQSSARAFMKDMAHDYETSRLGHIVLQPFSTVSGLDAVNDGSADMAGSARAPMPGRSEEQNTNFYPVAWDALVMITSPKNPVNNLTLKQLHDIYLGRVTNWADVGGPDGPLNLYAVAGPLDGNEYSLRDLVFHHGDQAVAVPRLYVNTEKLEEGIAIDPHGLGLTTLSAAQANPALKMLTIEEITPSPASVADGSYPLYSTLFLAARIDAKNKDEIEKFVHFAQGEGDLLRRHGLVPYGEAPQLATNSAARTAWIDARVYPQLTAAATPVATQETLVSAPNKTLQSQVRIAPPSDKALDAKDAAAHAEPNLAPQPGSR